jgi:stalled ribosome alternative rescue factor ArfA
MRQRKPRKARNMVAKAMHECKIFQPKVLLPKKGKGSIYKRTDKGRDMGSGPYSLGAILISFMTVV